MSLKRVYAFSIGMLTACGGSPDPFDPFTADHTGMEVEAIPYELLGSTKLFFSRFEPRAFGTISLDGGSRTADITYPTRGQGVAVEPATRMLAYMATFPNQPHDVFVRPWTSGVGQPLGGPGGSRYDPSWSPDGARLLYAEADAPGAIVRTRIVSQSPVAAATDRQILWSAANTCEFASSPKQRVGGDLVFILSDAAPVCAFRVSIARHTLGSQHQILYTAASATPLVVAWSPSGTRIAFTEVRHTGTHGTFDIKVMDANGSNLRTVTTVMNGTGGLGDGIFSLCWARDESRLFFDLPGARDGESHIYSILTTGGLIRPITTAPDASDRYLTCG